MGFIIKAEKVKLLKELINTLSGIVSETNIIISNEGFKILAMDPSRICLLQCIIPKEYFESYKLDVENETIALSLLDFDKILKRGSANDSISIQYINKEEKIKITLKRKNQSRTRTFSLRLIDSEFEDVPMSGLLEIDYQSKITLDLGLLNEAMKDAEIFGEVIAFLTEGNEGIKFHAEGQIGEMDYELKLEDLEESEINESSNSSYSIAYLIKILKISPITKKIELFLKTDHPLRINFLLENDALINYFLAPRVESTI